MTRIPHAILSRLDRRRALTVIAVAAAVYVAYFAGLGLNPLLDPDEPIYGQFIKEMVRGGDWLTPRYDGGLWFDKPPLFYWLSSICAKLLGHSELTVRMPSAIFATLIVLMTYFLVSHDFGKRAGALAGAVVGTSLLQLIMSHAAATDAVLVFFLTAGLYAYRRWLDTDARLPRLGWAAACGAAVGFGMLTKGPVAPLLLAAAMLLHLAWVRQLRRLRLPDLAAGVGLSVLIGLPWYIAMYVMHRQVFVDQFVLANNLERFLQPLHKSQTSHWTSYFRNIPIMLAFFFPWTVFLPQALVKGNRANAGWKLAICWIVVVVGFFSISRTQNFTYTYPAFPACALLVGAFLDGHAKRLAAAKRPLLVGLVVAGLTAAAIVVFIHGKFPQALPGAWVSAVVLVLVFAVPLGRMLSGKSGAREFPWLMAAGMAVFMAVAVCTVMPVVSDYKSSKKVARQVSSTPGVRVVAFRLWRPGMLYYLDRRPISADEEHDLARLAADRRPVLFVCSERDEHVVERYAPVQVYDCGDLDVYANGAFTRVASAAGRSGRTGI